MAEELFQKYINKLPPETEFSVSGGLKWNETKIADFFPVVIGKMKLLTGNGEEEWLRLGIVKENEVVAVKDVKVSNINEIDWFTISEKCIINPDCAKAKSYLINILQYMLSQITETSSCQIIEKVGWNKIKIFDKDIRSYYTGDRLILPQDITNDMRDRIKLKQSDWIIKADTERYSEKDATAEMIKLISLNKKAGLPIFAFTISALLKSVLRECGIPLKFILYILAPKNYLKTVYISLMSPISSRLDDKSKLILQLNSTTYSVDNLLTDYPDFSLVLDNVYISQDSETGRHIKKIFEEAVQIVGDDIGKSKAGKQYNPSSSIIVTGENDGIGNPSTLARYFTIPFGNALKNPATHTVLHKYQSEHQLIISTFYHYFLQWVVDNFDEIKTGISELLTDFRKVSGVLNISEKLRERYFILLISYMVFLKYCESKKFMTVQEIQQLKKSFSTQLIRFCKRHDKTIMEKEAQQNDNENTDDFFRLIQYWYKNGKFDMAEDENDKNLKNKEALVYDGCLCLRTEPLMRKINKSFPKTKLSHVIAYLVTKNVLKSDADRKTVKIKKIRFLKISLEKLYP